MTNGSYVGVSLALIAVLGGCSGREPAAPLPGTFLSGSVRLLTPAPGGRFVQNDPSIGCAVHSTRGSGFRLAFDWEDVAGANRYDIELKHVGAEFPAVSYHVTESRYEATFCNAFVIDSNLDHWIWRVAAIGGSDKGTAPDTLWSEEREYGFAACRLSDDRPCYADAP